MLPNETLALDVSLDGGVNASTTFGGTAPLKFGRAKTCKNWCDLRQLLSVSANISGSDEDSDKI